MSDPYEFPVEATHILMFARSVGDPNPIYSDEEYAKMSEVGSIIAPPTFPQAKAQFEPGYVLRPEIGKPWFGSGGQPSGVPRDELPGGTGLHAEQSFEYHRPLRPGDRLTITEKPGKQWEKQGRKGGLLKFSETVFEYRDASGELVVTARSVGVRTEKVVEEG